MVPNSSIPPSPKSYPLRGYSERGVINAVFETIAANYDCGGKKQLEDLLGRMVKWKVEDGETVSRFSPASGELVDFEIYVEPSLSEFGSPDVIVFAYFQGDSELQGHWETFFIEAKMKPFLMSSPPTSRELGDNSVYEELANRLEVKGKSNDKLSDRWHKISGHAIQDEGFYQTNGSTILHQLFLKYRLWETQLSLPVERIPAEEKKKGFKVYSGLDIESGRKIGITSMVTKLVLDLKLRISPDLDEEQNSRVHFVSLTTDPSPQHKDLSNNVFTDVQKWGLLGSAVSARFLKMIEWNSQKLDWKPAYLAVTWQEKSYLLSWLDVWDWANDQKLKRVRESLIENKEKFKWWNKNMKPFDGAES